MIRMKNSTCILYYSSGPHIEDRGNWGGFDRYVVSIQVSLLLYIYFIQFKLINQNYLFLILYVCVFLCTYVLVRIRNKLLNGWNSKIKQFPKSDH